MDSNAVEHSILKHLDSTPRSAKEILRELKAGGLKATKRDVNSTLYRMLKEGTVAKTNDEKPLWTKIGAELVKKEESSEEDVNTAVFIDISNSPCHIEAARFASRHCAIYIFAQNAYGGELPAHRAYVHSQRLAPNHTISTAIIVRATTFVCAMQQLKQPSRIIVVSKSNAFDGLKEALTITSQLCEVEIVREGWDELKMHLE